MVRFTKRSYIYELKYLKSVCNASKYTSSRGGSRIFEKGGAIFRVYKQEKGGSRRGPILGPVLISLHRGPKKGGYGPPGPPPPGSAHEFSNSYLRANMQYSSLYCGPATGGAQVSAVPSYGTRWRPMSYWLYYKLHSCSYSEFLFLAGWPKDF